MRQKRKNRMFILIRALGMIFLLMHLGLTRSVNISSRDVELPVEMEKAGDQEAVAGDEDSTITRSGDCSTVRDRLQPAFSVGRFSGV